VIVRILGEELDELNSLDDALQAAVDAGDDERFAQALEALLTRVRTAGRPLPDDEIVPSELVLPSADASLAEVSALLGDDGLIPG
jgi:hypothetical protein